MHAISQISMTGWWRSFGIEYGHTCTYNVDRIKAELFQPKVEIMPNGHLVSRGSDYIIYSVEAKNIDSVVKIFGPCMPLAFVQPILPNPNQTFQQLNSVP
jgi:hypothetical protein